MCHGDEVGQCCSGCLPGDESVNRVLCINGSGNRSSCGVAAPQSYREHDVSGDLKYGRATLLILVVPLDLVVLTEEAWACDLSKHGSFTLVI